MSFPEQPFGFVAGRWVRSIGDTPDDADRAPDYVPVETGTVLFTPQVTHRVAADATGWAGIIKERIPARLGERGQLIDAEGHDHLALAAGIYSVSYDFGSGRSWPSHYIEVRTEHTATAPLWLPPIAPPPVGPMIENRVVTIPEGGVDGQVLVWDGAGFSWADPPRGPEGPPGDVDAEQLAGASRLKNRLHDTTWLTSDSTIGSQTARTVTFTATAQNGHIRWNTTMVSGRSYYFTAEVKTTSDQVLFGSTVTPVYHSGSGDWERLTGMKGTPENLWFMVRDGRSSGWDQVEVRDPVLIDLTTVFGVGREPSREYMDALLANHGNYIGGVDQFAVGDALQALTVAGPGMSLRHDTTVGTRVFLDHPDGSTMLMGDTGARDVSTILANGWASTAGLRLRRVGQTVTLEGRLDGTNATSNVFLSLPSGFGFIGGSYTITGVIRGGDLVMRVGGTLETSLRFATLDILHSWNATPAWPTTLPGLPA